VIAVQQSVLQSEAVNAFKVDLWKVQQDMSKQSGRLELTKLHYCSRVWRGGVLLESCIFWDCVGGQFIMAWPVQYGLDKKN
jgi:hypothetical protein